MGEEELEASYWEMAGNALYRLREFPDAEKAYNEALKIFTELEKKNTEKCKLSLAVILENIGNFYCNTGKFSQAEKKHNEALEIMKALAEKNPDEYKPYMATILSNLGNLYKDAGKFFEAEEAYQKALEIRRNLADKNPKKYKPTVALTVNNLGLLQFDTELSRAKAEYEASKEEKEKLEKEIKKRIKELEKYDDAIKGAKEKCDEVSERIKEKYKEALDIYERLPKKEKYLSNVAGCWNNTGNLYEENEELNQAEKFYKKALKRYRNLEKQNPAAFAPDVATSLNNLGIFYNKREKSSQAKEAYNEAIEKYKQVAMWFDAARTYYNLSLVESDTEAVENSRRLLELAILFSKEEEYRYAQKGERESTYLSLLEKDISTFGVLEALRDPGLISLPWDDIISKGDLESAQKDLEIQKKLVEENTLKKDVESTLKEDFSYHEPTILRDNLIFIYIQIIRGSVYFFAVENGKMERFKCQGNFFEKGVRVYYSLVAQSKYKKGVQIFENKSKMWYKTLPQEIVELIQEKDYIVFSPDYYCSFLPLEALQRDVEPLCIEKTVLRATSLRQFSTVSESRELSFDSSLIVGNPWPKSYPNMRLFNEESLEYTLPSNPKKSYKISYLKGAEKEAKELKKKLPKPKLLLGNEATGGRFLSEVPRHSLIHFTGHGSLGRILFLSGPLKGFPPFEPEEFSNLRKAERTEGNRKINMMEEWHPVTDLEIADRQMKKDALVFLNACETGQHRYERGGYYQGLSAAFLKNGAHSVISSLIPLFDNASKEFADKFYSNLLTPKSVSQSLKEARNWIRNRKGYEAQVYWIPYLHYGLPF
ncbi:MAG: CHAT domain-containing protein [Theionarchaea archaeon]|nr:CHAT domain-containing protein [Theionarchaea archaeon]